MRNACPIRSGVLVFSLWYFVRGRPLQSSLVDTIKAPRSNLASTPSLFPVPVLFGDHLGRMPSSSNRRQRARIHISRATHAIVMALNYLHCGPSVDMSLLGRELSPLHFRVYAKVKSFLKTEVGTEPFLAPSAGRRFPQLDARLNELSSVVTQLGLSGNPYSRAFSGAEVPMDNTARALQVFRCRKIGFKVGRGTGSVLISWMTGLSFHSKILISCLLTVYLVLEKPLV